MTRGVGALLGKMGTLKKVKSDPRPLVIDTRNSEVVVHGDLNHSPLESPPLMKKKLRRLSSSILGSISSQSSPLPAELVMSRNTRHSKDMVDGSECVVSSKKDAYRTVTTKDRPTQPKKVQFDNEVTVHIMTDDGHICTQCQELSDDSKCRKEYIRQQNLKRISRSQCSSPYDTALTDLSNSYSAMYQMDFTKAESKAASHTDSYMGLQLANSNSTPPQSKSAQVNITFEQDSQNETKLRFLIYLGREYQPENIVVKANVNGSRLRVLATQMASMEDGRQVVQEFNERYALPMNVDPFRVEAKLDSKGYLAVVAPLMTLQKQERSQAPSSEE